jgi:hypothetical protein
MRRAFAGVDTASGFEARVAAGIAALQTPQADALRERMERQRSREARRLRRLAWLNAATAAGAGIAAIALVWREGPAVARWTEAALSAATDPGVLMGVALAALALGCWPVLRKMLPR